MDRLNIDFAGHGVALKCSDREVSGWFHDRFAPFCSAADTEWTIFFDVNGPTPNFLEWPREIYPERFETVVLKNGLEMRSRSYRAMVCLHRREVRVVGPKATFPIDGVLRLLLPVLIDDGLVIHGGMAQAKERGWVFSGPSGCGKTTLSAILAPKSRCDEMVAVRFHDGRWFAHALPFWQARPGTAALEGLFLLHHGEEDRRERMLPTEAARCLGREILWPVADEERLECRLALMARLVAEVPMWNLWFRPTPTVWRIISEAAV